MATACVLWNELVAIGPGLYRSSADWQTAFRRTALRVYSPAWATVGLAATQSLHSRRGGYNDALMSERAAEGESP